MRKRTGRVTWIARGAMATLMLAGGVYAADQVTAPAANDLGKTITDQRVKEGLPAKQAQDFEHQAQTLTHDQMIDLVGRYDAESKAAYEHAETTRIAAYRTRDIIRMTCIDDKLTQMKDVINVAAPRLQAFPSLASDELRMRQHFLVLQQARNRVMELASEVEGCMGDTLDAVTIGRIREEAPTVDTIFDPT